MRARIVYTTPGGGVAVCQPAPEIIAWMGCGGYWRDRPRGFLQTQIERKAARGIPEAAATRFCRAISFGGCTTGEALAIIRDMDCAPRGTGCEFWDVDDVPKNRWFRNAWIRSHNGGPISIDLEAARRVQAEHIETAVGIMNKRAASPVARFFDRLRAVKVDWGTIMDRIMCARDETELARVWPDFGNQ